jgi:hypothetical protein
VSSGPSGFNPRPRAGGRLPKSNSLASLHLQRPFREPPGRAFQIPLFGIGRTAHSIVKQRVAYGRERHGQKAPA